MRKSRQVVFFLLLGVSFFACRKKSKSEYVFIPAAEPKIEIEPDKKVDKEKLKELSITIGVDSMNKLIYSYEDSLGNFFSKFSYLALNKLPELFTLDRSWAEVGKIGDLRANSYCLINFKEHKEYWSIYLLSQYSSSGSGEDGTYLSSIIHLLTFDSSNHFINAAPVMRHIYSSMSGHMGWSDFRMLSDTSFFVSIMDRYGDSFDSDHVKDYHGTFDSIGYTLLVDKRGYFYQLNPYRIHRVILD